MKLTPNKPFITGAAIKYNKDNLVLTGMRHGDPIFLRAILFGERSIIGQTCVDGFVLNTGRFVTRAEAVPIAIESGQIPSDFKGTLYSEDLW